MITLSLLKFLENNGFGKIDKDLFWQKLGLGKDGIYIVSIGQASSKFRRRVQRYELYSRAETDLKALKQLEAVADFLSQVETYDTCELPAVPKYGIENSYRNITISPVSTPTRVGEDTKGRIIWSVSGTISY